MTTTALAPIRPKRSYPKTLKAQIVAECGQAGASIASVAMAHGVNANLVHKWIRQVSRRPPEPATFVPVMVPSTLARPIEIELSRGQSRVRVRWPASEAGSGVAARVVAVIHLEAIWLATEPLDMRAGTETAVARVVAVFGGGLCGSGPGRARTSLWMPSSGRHWCWACPGSTWVLAGRSRCCSAIGQDANIGPAAAAEYYRS